MCSINNKAAVHAACMICSSANLSFNCTLLNSAANCKHMNLVPYTPVDNAHVRSPWCCTVLAASICSKAGLTHVHSCFAGVGSQKHIPSGTVMALVVIISCVD